MTDPDTTKRPYELTGAAYAVWYDVGEMLTDINAQNVVGTMLCNGSSELPKSLDPLTAVRIIQIAAKRGIELKTG